MNVETQKVEKLIEKYNKEKKNYKVSNESANIPDGKTVARMVEKVYFLVTAVHNRKDHYSTDPWYPNNPFDVIATGYLLISR